jgi:hypothetical protein
MAWILRLGGLSRDACQRANDLTGRALMLELAGTEEAALRAELLGNPAQIVSASVVHQSVRSALAHYIRYGVAPLAALRRVESRTTGDVAALGAIADRVEQEAAAAPRPRPRTRRGAMS